MRLTRRPYVLAVDPKPARVADGAGAVSFAPTLAVAITGRATVLQSLVVRQGAGAISVPSGYFNRGLCVIVYTSPTLARVLTTKRI